MPFPVECGGCTDREYLCDSGVRYAARRCGGKGHSMILHASPLFFDELGWSFEEDSLLGVASLVRWIVLTEILRVV